MGNETVPFSGSYNGNGHCLDGLYMEKGSADYAGLFGRVENAHIANLGLTNADIHGHYYVGGLVGYAENANIHDCFVESRLSGSRFVGGLSGYAKNASLIRCYNVSDMEGACFVGGLAGYVYYSQIAHSYSAGTVDGLSETGGLIGFNFDSIVTASFWDMDISEQEESAGGIGKSSAEMQQLETFTEAGWDFAEETANGNGDYWYYQPEQTPLLIWQVPFRASFTASPRIAFVGDAIHFSNQSVGTIISYLWDFGDGASSSEENPTHMYAQAGDYTVSLTVSDSVQTHTSLQEAFIQIVAETDSTYCVAVDSVLTGLDNTVEVNIHVSGIACPDSIIAYDFSLGYTDSLLEYVNYQVENTLSDQGTVMVNAQENGQLHVGFMNAQPLAGDGVLIRLQFHALAAGIAPVTISNFHLNTEPVLNVEAGEVHILPVYYGDVDYNTEVTAYDAALALQYAVGLDPLPELDPLPWEMERIIAADVDQNGLVIAYDAALILSYAVGNIQTLPVLESKYLIKNQPQVELIYEHGKISVYASGDVYALNLNIPEDAKLRLGEPIILDENMLSALNTQNDYRVAVCSAEIETAYHKIMEIPAVACGQKLHIEMMINDQKSSQSLAMIIPVTVHENNYMGNYPNPFNPETTIQFAVKENNTPVTVEIYNVKGQLVKRLYSDEMDLGMHSLVWRGQNEAGQAVSSGLYFSRVQIGTFQSIGKMMLLK